VRAVSHQRIEEDGEVDYELHPLNVVELSVTKSMRVRDVKAQMIEQLGLRDVRAEQLVMANQRMGKISEYLKDTTSCDDID